MTAAQYLATESEASVEERVTAWLKERGYRVHPLVAEMPRGYKGRARLNEPGTPDLLAMMRPNHPNAWNPISWPGNIYLELKRAKGGPYRKAQLEMADTLRDEGFRVFQHQSNGVDVIKQLEEWMNR